MTGLGIMSGSSVDGIDVALVSFEYSGKSLLDWTLNETAFFELPEDMRNRLAAARLLSVSDLSKLERDYTLEILKSIIPFMEPKQVIDYIALHGHTVVHKPKEGKSHQLGDGRLMADKTGLPTIVDFRTEDIRHGGEGAPMAVLADRDLFPGYRAYLNLGGICNASVSCQGLWKAFDIGPCNQLLNHFAKECGLSYDKDGRLAADGIPDVAFLSQVAEHEYFKRQPPKSLDNTQVGQWWINAFQNHFHDPVNALATAVELIGWIVKEALEPLILSHGRVLVTGGGARNTFLVETIRRYIHDIGLEVFIPGDAFIDYKEAILMAYAGSLRLKGEPNFISEATGARCDVIGGQLYIPEKEKPLEIQ